MKLVKAVAVVLFAFCFTFVHAQNSTVKEIKILNNYGAIPFEDGETIIAEVRFMGLDSDYAEYDKAVGKVIAESDCRKMLRSHQAEIKSDDKFYGDKVSKAVKTLRQWLFSKGYPKPEISAFGEKLLTNQMTLTFKIDRSALVRISEIRFVGNVNLTNNELIENFKQCSHDDWEIFDARKYEYFSQGCSRRLMFSKGYFRAKIERIKPQLVNGERVVTIAVDEGVRYRYGNIKIEGAKIFTEKELLEIGKLKTGDVADGKALQDFVYEELKELYGNKGYVLYEAEFDPTLIESQVEGLDATVHVLITIDEGALFKLQNIKFLGIEKEKAEELRKSFSLQDGETYNKSEIEKGFKRINETNEFYPLEIDERDVEIRTNEGLKNIQLVISVKRLN